MIPQKGRVNKSLLLWFLLFPTLTLFGCLTAGAGLQQSTSTGGDVEGRGAGSSGEVVGRNLVGFSAWGGIASSEGYRNLADPAGIVSGNAQMEGGGFGGKVGINPSEVLAP